MLYLPLKDVQKIFIFAKDLRAYCLAGCFFWGGLRLSETRNLRVENLNFAEAHFTVEYGWYRRDVLFLNTKFMEAMKEFVGRRKKGVVFNQTAQYGDPQKPMPRQAMQRQINEAGEVCAG